jgi:hypothetical protein
MQNKKMIKSFSLLNKRAKDAKVTFEIFEIFLKKVCLQPVGDMLV